MKRKIFFIIGIVFFGLFFVGCSSDSVVLNEEVNEDTGEVVQKKEVVKLPEFPEEDEN